MRVLIIDDDRYVVASLQKMVRWDSLGFDEVYTAAEIATAKKILQEKHLHLVISDIDMPNGTGLDLLAWIREQGNEVPVIFLTNYADFSYAQRAVELHSFHYFLKPIQYGRLEEIIREATKQYRRDHSARIRNYEEFWKKYLSMAPEDVPRALPSLLEEEQFPRPLRGSFYLPVLFDVYPWSLTEDFSPYSPFSSEEALSGYLSSTFRAVFEDCLVPESIFMPCEAGPTSFLAILPVSCAGVQAEPEMACERYVNQIHGEMDISISCFVGEACTVADFHAVFCRLLDAAHSRPDARQTVCLLREYRAPYEDYLPVDTSVMEFYLESRQYDACIRFCMEYLHRLALSRKLSSQSMHGFHADFRQTLLIFLKKRGISGNQLMKDDPHPFLSDLSCTSLTAMETYITYMVHLAERQLPVAGEARPHPEQIRRYIDAHYAEDLSGNRIYELFFLDPDYASRLFKKRYNLSIKNYQTQKRLEAACQLLRTTSLPVNTISASVGYDNYSYFSRLFRKWYGITPMEYRQMQDPPPGMPEGSAQAVE